MPSLVSLFIIRAHCTTYIWCIKADTTIQCDPSHHRDEDIRSTSPQSPSFLAVEKTPSIKTKSPSPPKDQKDLKVTEKERDVEPQAQMLAPVAEMKEKAEEGGEKEKLVVAVEE